MAKNKNSELIYQLDGIPPLGQAIPLGLQHVLAMFVGNVAPIIIISNALGLPVEQKTFLIQCAMLVAGVNSLIQCYSIGPIGARLPIVMGTSFAFLPTCLAIATKYGLPGVFGAALCGGLFEMLLGSSLRKVRHHFKPFISGIVVLSIGLSLIPTGIKYLAGGQGSPDFGSASNLLLGAIVLVVILFFKEFTKGITSISSILIGLVVGYFVAIGMGKIDFTAVSQASWVAIPVPLSLGIEFHLDAILSMILIFMVSAVETIGDISGITMGGAKREATDKELVGGIMQDGMGSIIASLFNVFPNTSFSQNVGIIEMTGVINRFCVAVGACFLIIAGLFPKVGAIVAIMPDSVLGGAAVIMFSMITVSGMKLITKEPLTQRTGLIVAVSLGLGFGLGSVPEALAVFPEAIQMIFGSSGIVVSVAVALILNLILPKKEEDLIIEGKIKKNNNEDVSQVVTN